MLNAFKKITKHLFKLFENKLPLIEPDLGIELFVMEAPVVEDHIPQQEKFWDSAGGLEDVRLADEARREASCCDDKPEHKS